MENLWGLMKTKHFGDGALFRRDCLVIVHIGGIVVLLVEALLNRTGSLEALKESWIA